MISKGLLCPQPIKLNGLFLHALIRPDQVDIWDQVYLNVRWDEQMNEAMLLGMPLVHIKTGGFFVRNES